MKITKQELKELIKNGKVEIERNNAHTNYYEILEVQNDSWKL